MKCLHGLASGCVRCREQRELAMLDVLRRIAAALEESNELTRRAFDEQDEAIVKSAEAAARAYALERMRSITGGKA